MTNIIVISSVEDELYRKQSDMVTIEQQKPVLELHLEHELWIKELLFWKEEIAVMEKYLAQVNAWLNTLESKAGVEHFQNQFIRQREVIDELKHEIRVNEETLSARLRNLTGPEADTKRLVDHDITREKVLITRKIYQDLKEEYRSWLVRIL